MKGNTKKSILDINAVKILHVESCYKIFMSAYKKSNNNDDITHVSNLPFDEMFLFIEWNKYMKPRLDNWQSICNSK